MDFEINEKRVKGEVKYDNFEEKDGFFFVGRPRSRVTKRTMKTYIIRAPITLPERDCQAPSPFEKDLYFSSL